MSDPNRFTRTACHRPQQPDGLRPVHILGLVCLVFVVACTAVAHLTPAPPDQSHRLAIDPPEMGQVGMLSNGDNADTILVGGTSDAWGKILSDAIGNATAHTESMLATGGPSGAVHVRIQSGSHAGEEAWLAMEWLRKLPEASI